MSFFAVLICIFVSVEVTLWLLLRYLRRDFQWLILGTDRCPKLDPKALRNFLQNGADMELGWIKKPNTNGKEKGENGKKTQYSMNKYGARSNPGFDDRRPIVSVFGDSYAFCRQVDDDQAWSNAVSRKLNLNILNYGVGNYGLDQAVLRMNRELAIAQTKLSVVVVVPETICRIHTVWKHYSEYGNTLAFKPRFKLKNKELTFVPNIINSSEKYENYNRYLYKITQEDYFYSTKFQKDILEFPYAISMLKSFRRNLPLVRALLESKFVDTPESKHRPLQMVLDRNHDIVRSLYDKKDAVELLRLIVLYGQEVARKHENDFLFCMIPQLQDLKLVKKWGNYYQPFLAQLSVKCKTLDLTPLLLSKFDFTKCFTHDVYGGHLSEYGNSIVSEALAENIKQLLKNFRSEC